MPIVPPQVITLLQAYDRAVNEATDFVQAASEFAPAAVRDIVCRVGGLASLGGGLFGEFQRPGSFGRTNADIGGILQAACPLPPPPPENGGEPPFLGGQCPGVLYDVEYAYFQTGPFGQPRRRIVPPQSPRPALGPISAIYPAQERAPGEFGQVRITQQNGDFVWNQFASNTFIDEVEVVSVTRQDGLPDDCGDLPSPPQEPRPPIVQPPRSPGIPYTRPDGSPGPEIFVDVRVGPVYVDVDATLKVPVVVSFEGGDIENNVTIPVSVSLPDFNVEINYGGNGGNPGEPQSPQEPTPPEGICCDPPPPRLRDGEEENPEQPPEIDPPVASKIVGVVVTSSQDGSGVNNSTIFTAAPPLLVPRIATVQFGISAGDLEAIGPDVQVKQRVQYVSAPADVDITRAFVRWEPGWSGSFQYVEAPANKNL